MKELPKRIHDDNNGLDYVLVGDYYIPALRLTEESRPIGHWGRRRKAYLEEARPALYCSLLLSGKLWTHLADVDEQLELMPASTHTGYYLTQAPQVRQLRSPPASREILKKEGGFGIETDTAQRTLRQKRHVQPTPQ